MTVAKDITIQQGKTYTLVLCWEKKPIVYKTISSIQQSAPVSLTVTGHGLQSGWRVAITNVKGMVDINAEANNIKDKDYNEVTVVDPNTITINNINATGFKPYVSGGVLQYNTPVDLTGYTARMAVKDKIGGTVLASTDVAAAPLNTITVALNTTLNTITIGISATSTAAFSWTKGVYELELVSATGVVTSVIAGNVVVTKEVTT